MGVGRSFTGHWTFHDTLKVSYNTCTRNVSVGPWIIN
jgi:hypothetical protein